MILRTLLSVNRSRHFANPYVFPNDQITSSKRDACLMLRAKAKHNVGGIDGIELLSRLAVKGTGRGGRLQNPMCADHLRCFIDDQSDRKVLMLP